MQSLLLPSRRKQVPVRVSITTGPGVCLVLLLLSNLLILVSAQSKFSFTSTCLSTSRFDIASLSCEVCGTGKQATSDGQSCQCTAPNYIVDDVSTYDHTVFTCSACTAGQVPSSDSSRCMTCDGTTAGIVGNDCACTASAGNADPGRRLVEKDAAGNWLSAKACIACPSYGRVSSTNAYTCDLCPHTSQTKDTAGTCTCGAGYTAAGSSCVLTTLATPLLSTVTPASTVLYSAIQSTDDGSSSSRSIVSATLQDIYLHAAVNCDSFRYRESCHALSNICAMQKFLTTAVACSKFGVIADSIGTITHGFAAWKTAMPLLSYVDSATLSSTLLTTKVSLSEVASESTDRATVSSLKFYLMKFAFNGTYLGYEKLAGQLQLCGGDPDDVQRFLRFGTTYENKCSLFLRKLLTGAEQVLYELYYVDGNDNLYPVPVSVSNGPNPSILHQRFFLADTVSSKRTLAGDPEILVFARSIKLLVRLQDGSSDLIYPPSLSIEYGEREVSRISTGTANSESVSACSFTTDYSKDLDGFWTAALVLFVLGWAAIAVIWFIRMMTYQKMNIALQVDCSFVTRALLMLLDVMGNVFFWIAFVLTSYAFVFYKGQTSAFFLVPDRSGSEVYTLAVIVGLAFWSKFFGVLRSIWGQITADVFFIDWEQPRGVLNANDAMNDMEQRPVPVSVWRKILVVNEWRELMTARMINVPVTLILIAFLMRGVGLEYLATAQPVMSDLSDDAAPIHPLLRFAVSTFFWVLIVAIQYLVGKFYYRFYEDVSAQFVELLTFANISCFVMDERFHGYYLHGKTVHTNADVSLEEMTQQIASEEKNWTKERGLIDGKDSFEVYFSRQFRAHYDKVFLSVLANEHKIRARRIRERNAPGGGRGGMGAREAGGDIEMTGGGMGNDMVAGNADFFVSRELMEATRVFNMFMMAFMEKATPNYPWRERPRNYIQRRCDLIPQLNVAETNITTFFYDEDSHWTRSVLLGIEYDLIILLILFYSCLDLLFSNTLVSVLATYAMNWMIESIRDHWGAKNLSKKTIINERFLL
jgi:meckelin